MADSTNPSMKTRLNQKFWRVAIGLLVTVISLFLALRDVTWVEVHSAFEQADFAYVGWALISTIGIVLARVLRWKVLMAEEGADVPLSRNLMALLAGQALNLIYPARIGDLSRAYLVDEVGTRRVFMFGTVVLEKLFDAVTYVLMFFLLVLLLPMPNWLSSSGYTFALLTIVSLAMFFIVAHHLEWFSARLRLLSGHLPVRFSGRLNDWMASSLTSLVVLKSRNGLLKLSVLSILVWVIPVFTNHLTLLALQIQLPLSASLLTMIVLQASVAIPSVPGRIGLFQYLCILSLSLFGVAESLAFTYGVLLHGIALLPSTLAGLIFLWVLSLQGKKPVRQVLAPEELSEVSEPARD